MITKQSHKPIGWYIYLAGISLCLFLQISCATVGYDPTKMGLNYDDVPCSPAEARSQIRQYFANQSIRTSEENDGKSVLMTTIFVDDPKSGRRERHAKYMVEVKPVENANKSSVTLKWAVQSKGEREKTWYDVEGTESEPRYVKPISQQIQSICRSGQQ